MTKQYYQYDDSVSPEKNLALAIYALANEFHELTAWVASLGFADRTLPDGSVYEMGALELVAYEIKNGFRLLADAIDRD